MNKQFFILMFSILLFSISPSRACLEEEKERKGITYGSFQGHNSEIGINKPLTESVRSRFVPGSFGRTERWIFSFASNQTKPIFLGSTSSFNIKKGQSIAIQYDIEVTKGNVYIALTDSRNNVLHTLSKHYCGGEKTFKVHNQKMVTDNKEGVKLALMACGNVTEGGCEIKFLYHVHNEQKEELKKK